MPLAQHDRVLWFLLPDAGLDFAGGQFELAEQDLPQSARALHGRPRTGGLGSRPRSLAIARHSRRTRRQSALRDTVSSSNVAGPVDRQLTLINTGLSLAARQPGEVLPRSCALGGIPAADSL